MNTALRSVVLGLALAAGLDAAATVSVLPGSAPQTVNNGSYFAPIRLRVTSEGGTPVAGADVYWTLPNTSWQTLVYEDHGNCVHQEDIGDVCTVKTGPDGTAEMNTTYAIYAGSYTIRVFARTGDQAMELGSTEVLLTVVPRTTPATLYAFGQSNRSGVRGTVLARPFVARMFNADGAPIAGVPVTFSRGEIRPAGAAGLFNGNLSATVITDDEGYAEAPEFRITSGLGLGRIVARAIDTTANAVIEANFFFTSTTLDGSTSLAVEDLWWGGPDEGGWGLSIAQRGEHLFGVVFAYDDAGRPTWYALDGGGFAADGLYERFVARTYSPRGSPHFAYDATRFVPGQAGGAAEFQFYAQDDATLRMTLGDRTFSKSIRRFELSGNGFPPFPELSGTYWGGPSQNGWAVALSVKNGGLFAIWYTYDESGNRTWFTMSGGTWIDRFTHMGTIYRTRGPTWPIYDRTLLEITPVGSYALSFQGNGAVLFDWIIGPRSQRTQMFRYQP